MAAPMSDEELYQLTGSWEAAAALRDEQRQAPAAEARQFTPLSATPTLAELKAMYNQMGATQARENVTEQGTTIDYIPVQYGGGWMAGEKDNRKIIDYIGQGMDATPVYDDAPKTLSGFSRQEGDYITDYDLEGNAIARRKWNESDLKRMWNDLGPLAMAAITMGGGAGMLGNSLFGLTGTAAAGAGGALAGGFNAAVNDQNILTGALKGGLGSAGAMEIGDTGFKLGDINKAINFAKDPTLTGAFNLASPYLDTNFNIGDTGISLNDVVKGVGTAKALGSGNDKQVFDAITGLVRSSSSPNLKTSFGPGNMDEFKENLIPGYFQPGGEGYIDPNRGEMTVTEDPEGLDGFLRSLSPYATDDGKSIFTQTEEIPEMETVAKRPTSLVDVLGNPDILEELPYVPSIRTKEIKSDIPDEITADQIDTLFPDLDINDILQLVTDDTEVKKDDVVDDDDENKCGPGFHDDGTGFCVPDDDVKEDGCPEGYVLDLATNQCVKVGDTKVTVPPKAVVPAKKKTEDKMADLGLRREAPSQDPYANIKSMEDLFSGDIAYKLRALGMNPSQKTASADMDELVRLLRG
jgi:hypothetical protein